MKKTYISPKAKGVILEAESMIANSFIGGQGGNSGGIDTSTEGGDVEETRGQSPIWDSWK